MCYYVLKRGKNYTLFLFQDEYLFFLFRITSVFGIFREKVAWWLGRGNGKLEVVTNYFFVLLEKYQKI